MVQDRADLAVVLVDVTGGRELDAVAAVLAGGLGIPTVRISAGELGAATITLELGSGVLTVDGRRVRPTVCWVRHAGAPVLWAYAGSGFDLRSWSAFLAQIAAVAVVSLPGREPGHVEQLVGARRLGISVPRTTVTTGAGAAAGPGANVVKSVGLHFADRAEPCPAEIVERGDRPPVWAAGRTPAIVQQYVPHARELRVYYLDGAVCSFEVRKRVPSAIWLDPGGVEVVLARRSRAVGELVSRLAKTWELRFGAFDLLETPGGDLVFLEVNADGDWLWYEGRAAAPGDVTFLAAAMVSELHARAVREVGVA